MCIFTFRKATNEDIPFLVDTIIEAEKSGTDILTYTTIFGLSEKEARHYITLMLEEEIDGCELSVSGFFLSENNNNIVGAVCSWIEGKEGISSTVLKGNLLNYILPTSNIRNAIQLSKVVQDLHIEYKANTLQIGLVYVAKEARGKGLVKLLLDKIIELEKRENPEITEANIQVFGNNIAAIRAYEKAGFSIVHEKKSYLSEINSIMPGDRKVVMYRYI